MYYKKIFMDDNGFLSYLIGCPVAKVACIIDPIKGEVHEYISAAEKFGMEITHIFDTCASANHLNGNMELKLRTGADIYYLRDFADQQLNHRIARERDVFNFGNARLEIIDSPCHDPYVNSILLTDTTNGKEPWLILKRDSLFVGDLGWPGIGGRELTDKLNDYLDTDEKKHNEPISCPELDYDGYQNYKEDSGYAQFSVG